MLRLFPNPATDVLHVELTHGFSAETVFCIYDIAGKQRYMHHALEAKGDILVKGLAPGYYFLCCQQAGRPIVVARFIKQ